MDNVEYMHSIGWRACLNFDGSKALVRRDTKAATNVFSDREEYWHAFRAYQDEQRKKGEIIILPILSDRKKWYTLNYEEFRFECINNMPRIDVYKNVIGGFTNFRWREGYPKGGMAHG